MRHARRLFACALVLLLIGETSGLARAFGPGSTVRCCCGPHAAARPCPCPDCPVTRRLRATHPDVTEARLAAGRDCAGASPEDPGVLSVLAIATAALAAVGVPAPRRVSAVAAPLPMRGRAVDVGRPPP